MPLFARKSLYSGSWRALGWSSAIQAVGSAAALGAVSVVAHLRGPAAQGSFSAIKAEIDFLAVTLCFGLPQALFFAIQTRHLTQRDGVLVALTHSLIATLAVWLWSSVIADQGTLASLLYSGTVGAAVAYSSLRGAALASRTTTEFSVLSAAPGVLLLAVVVLALCFELPTGESRNWTLGLFSVVYLVTSVMGIASSRVPRLPRLTDLSLRRLQELYRYGGATWLSASTQSAGALCAFAWLEHVLVLPEEVGIFSAGLVLVSLLVTPLNLAAPLLLKHWTGRNAEGRKDEFLYLSGAFIALAAVLCGMVALSRDAIVAVAFGAAYLDHSGVIALTACAVPTQGLTKIVGIALSAAGNPGTAALVDIARLMALASGLLFWGDSLQNVAIAWLVAEYSSALIAIAILARQRWKR